MRPERLLDGLCNPANSNILHSLLDHSQSIKGHEKKKIYIYIYIWINARKHIFLYIHNPLQNKPLSKLTCITTFALFMCRESTARNVQHYSIVLLQKRFGKSQRDREMRKRGREHLRMFAQTDQAKPITRYECSAPFFHPDLILSFEALSWIASLQLNPEGCQLPAINDLTD